MSTDWNPDTQTGWRYLAMFSLPASLALTVLFAATGAYALLRWVALRTGEADRPGDPAAELAHLAMSLAMLGMVWGYGAGPAAAWAQVALFALLTVHFLVRRAGARRDPDGPAAHCPAPLFHALMCASMVWMPVAMPVLMPGHAAGGGTHEMDGMVMTTGGGSGPGDLLPATAAPAVWAVSGLVVLGLVLAAGYWARRLRVAPPAPAPVPAVAGHHPAAGGVPETAASPATMPATRTPAVLAWTNARTDAACHLLMSLGMAASLPLMS